VAIKLSRPFSAKDFSGATTDISFLLIIFFLVSAVFISDKGILLRVPEVPPEPREVPLERVLVLNLFDGDSEFALDQERYALTELAAVLSVRMSGWQPEAAVIQAEAEVRYGTVLAVMEAVRRSGVELFSVSAAGRPLAVNLAQELPEAQP